MTEGMQYERKSGRADGMADAQEKDGTTKVLVTDRMFKNVLPSHRQSNWETMGIQIGNSSP